MNSFERFAPTVLQVYRRDSEAFWAAILAPFMSDENPLLTYLPHLKVYKDLLSAFKGMNGEAQQILKDFSLPLGVDVTKWKSSLYFKDFYQIFAFLAIWMEDQGVGGIIKHFGTVIRAAVYGTAGYGILDANLDGNDPSPVQIMTAQALIAEYETLILQVFGVTEVNLKIIHKMRSRFFAAEIKEKSARWKTSPYKIDAPDDCGAKAAHAITPFLLSLEKAGKADLLDDYWKACMLFSGVVQILDDWTDLEKDLNTGHFSYVTLGFENLSGQKDSKKTARALRADKPRVQDIYNRCRGLLRQSRSIFKRINDPCLVRFVDLIESRLNSYCQKKLMLVYSDQNVRDPFVLQVKGSPDYGNLARETDEQPRRCIL